MTQRFNPPDLRKLLRKLHRGPKQSNAELVAELAALHIEDDATTEAAARTVAGLLSRTAYGFMQAKLGPSRFRDRLHDRRYPRRTMRLIASRLNAVNRKVVTLYEEDFGTTRATLHRLNEICEDPRHTVPYFEVLVQTAAQHYLPTKTWDLLALSNEALPLLLDGRGKLLEFAEDIVARGESLKAYGGDTNTILGAYDWLRKDPEFSFARIPTDADANYDLGGGFATPDVSDLFGVPFVSHDLTPPTRARELDIGVCRRTTVNGKVRRRNVSPEEREAHFRRLDAQPWRSFDVFADAFDPSHRKYLITSFGFASSSVTSLSPAQSEIPIKFRASNTTYCAMRVVLELVGLGRDVSLLTIHRSTRRAFMNRVVFLRFADHRLRDHQFVTEPFQGKYSRGVVPLTIPKHGRAAKT